MRALILLAVFCGLACGCGRNGSSGSPAGYNQGHTNAEVQAGADPTATDTRPTGGSMAGAGGAGPGYDGSSQGMGKHGTVPAPGAGFANALTNSQATTNQPGPAQPAATSNPGKK